MSEVGKPVRSRHGFLANRSISAKVYTLAGSILAVLAVLGGSSCVSTSTIETAFHDYTEVVRSDASVREIDIHFLKLRRFAREYLVGDIEDSAAKVGPAAEELRSALKVSEEAIDDPAMKEIAADIAKQADGYLAHYGAAATMKSDQHRLVVEVMDAEGREAREIADRIEANLVKSNDPKLVEIGGRMIEMIMMTRLNANKALDRHDEESLAIAETAFKDFKALLGEIERDAKALVGEADLRTLGVVMTDFHEGYIAALDLEAKLADLVGGTMTNAAEAVEADIAEVVRLGAEREEALEQETIELGAFLMATATALATAGFLVGLGLAYSIGRTISKPVQAMTSAMAAVAEGKLDTQIPGIGRKDEIGRMADTLNVFKSNLAETERLRVEQEDAKRVAEERRRADMLALATAFERAVGSVVEGVASASVQLQTSAQTVSASSEQVSAQAGIVSGASEEATNNVQTVAGAAEELASSVAEISRQVQDSADIASRAFKDAEETAAKVRELSTAAQRIGEVVNLIETIAAQTNLLALNATIEAARAGDAGRGFAVVASEVKQLATETGKATAEIAGQIAGIQSATEQSALAIGSIHDVIANMHRIASAIAASVEQQGAATQEIARNVQEAYGSTAEVTRNIEGVKEASLSSARSAGELLGAATDLTRQSGVLKTEVDRFLATVRAA